MEFLNFAQFLSYPKGIPVSLGKIYEMFALCFDNSWEKVVDISYNAGTDNVYISNDDYWLENIVKIKIVKVVKLYE
jgi:hypothetical protein